MDDALPELVRARVARETGTRAQLQRELRAGALERIRPGVYVPPTGGTPEDHHRLLMHAIAETEGQVVFSHRSAALAWGLPLIYAPPAKASVAMGVRNGGRSTTTIRRHGVEPGVPVVRDGLLVTALARTVVDVARATSLHEAVAVADAALRGSQPHELGPSRLPIELELLVAELTAAGRRRGVATARAALGMASASSGSAGESCSRVTMRLAGLPDPELQAEFRDARGLIGYADFWWPQFHLIGEFDGYIKYSDPRFLRGRTPEQALRDEKTREDRLRAIGPRVARWGWAEAFSPRVLRQRLGL